VVDTKATSSVIKSVSNVNSNLKSELKTDFIEKENYEMLLKQYNILEKHCISLELNNQLNTELFQRDNMSPSDSGPNFADLFKFNDLKAQTQEKDTVILKLKEKIKSLRTDDKESKVEDIETQNLELDHRVTKLTAKNNHLKQTYKQLFDSVKSSRVQTKEQCDDLIHQVNLKSVEIADLNASLQERVLVISALKEQLKGKAVLSKAVSLNPIDPAILQNQQIRSTPQITKSAKPSVDTSTSLNIDSNTPVLSSTGVALASSASESKSKDNTKNNKIRRSHKKAKETKLEDHPRKVKSSLYKASVVDSRSSSSVIKSVSNVNANLKCASCNGCLFADNHDKCVVEYINSVNACRKSKSANTPLDRKVWKTTGKVFKTVGYKWRPTGRIFTLVGNVCPLPRIATAPLAPRREPIPLVQNTDKPVVTLVYTRKPRAKHVPNKMEPNM
nr:hypothetical protein [Tanacetum cinerariifolium]